MVAARSKYGTLAANTVKTETLDMRYPKVEVVNRDATAEIFFTVDGSSPTVEGDGTYFLLGGQSLLIPVQTSMDPTVVKLISTGTPKYAVSGSELASPSRE